jgi:tRNA(Ile)-lysidine synthase
MLEQGVLQAVGATDAVVLAVSGGADSMALLHGWLESQTLTSTVVVAHFDHRLRPESSPDADWVQAKAESLGLPYEIGVWDEPTAGENAARKARLRFLTNVAEARRTRTIVTAHTRDDQAETILFRILRGTGMDGLKGIPSTRRLSHAAYLLRPMLAVPRLLCRAFLSSRDLQWREDPSNATMDFARNRLRNELIPLLEQRYNSRVVDALVHLSENAKEQGMLQNLRLDQLWEPIEHRWNHRPDESSIPRDAFDQMFPMEFKLIVRTLFREREWPMGRMSADHWNRLAALIDAKHETRWQGPDGMTAVMTATDFIVRRTG